jgi:rhodanese-related sulfurtransferase
MTDFAIKQNFGEPFGTISVQVLAKQLAESTAKIQLVDVREPEEIAIAYIPGFEVLPLSQFEHWSTRILVDFDPEIETLVLCHHGMRSAQMCAWLVRQGFSNVKNISGGIAAYSELVDRSMPRY